MMATERREPAPFRVYKSRGEWFLYQSRWPIKPLRFDTPAEAIDYVYKHWPWWP